MTNPLEKPCGTCGMFRLTSFAGGALKLCPECKLMRPVDDKKLAEHPKEEGKS